MNVKSIADAIVDVLSRFGQVEAIAPDAFFERYHERLKDVYWLPTYVFVVKQRFWGVSIFCGDRVVPFALDQMKLAKERLGQLQPVYFVPHPDEVGFLLEECNDRGIQIISQIGSRYDFLPAATPRMHGVPVDVLSRIPVRLVQRVKECASLAPGFIDVIQEFAARHSELLGTGSLSEDEEKKLLHEIFSDLLRADTRFAGTYQPLDMLAEFERQFRTSTSAFRDHFFHAFQNFLWGCIVVSDLRTVFMQFAEESFPGTANFSPEYVWLLTALYHDIGYTVQRRSDLDRLQFGVDLTADPFGRGREEEIKELDMKRLQNNWESLGYIQARTQLASLYAHLTQDVIEDDWTAEPSVTAGLSNNPFDEALWEAFAEGHAVASAIKAVAYLFEEVAEEEDVTRRGFLTKHAVLSGLSMLFHDCRVRLALRKRGIDQIRASRFPFAVLLMYIDAIQEDRRALEIERSSLDVMSDLNVSDGAIYIQMDCSRLGEEQLHEMRREVADVLSFAVRDVLSIEFPPELAGNSHSQWDHPVA